MGCRMTFSKWASLAVDARPAFHPTPNPGGCMRIISITALSLLFVGGITLSGCTGTRTASANESKSYPFITCVVGGEKLGSMGPILREVKDGYEVKFCCPECKDKFDRMPTQYLEKIKNAHIQLPETGG